MATDFIAKLDTLVKDSGDDWRTFIRRLSPIHAQWHTEHNAGTATLGFLLFHWELIQRFKRVGADRGLGGLTGIHAYTAAQLTSFNAHYDVQDSVAASDVAGLENFSLDVEAWHGDAHMNVGMATHHNLMNPRTNVRRPEFWRLHYFINDRFEEQLRNFAASASATPGDVVAQLEAKTGAVVAAI